MKVKKFLAAVTSVLMVASSMSVVASAAGSPTVDKGLTGGTGRVTSKTDDTGAINVDVKLVPSTPGGTVTGEPENGTGPRNNYHIEIPMEEFTASGWTLTTENGGQYTPDNEEHTDWNVADGKVMLWLPVSNGTCKVVLKNGSDYKVINVKTKVVDTTPAAPANVTVEEPDVSTPPAEENPTTPANPEKPDEKDEFGEVEVDASSFSTGSDSKKGNAVAGASSGSAAAVDVANSAQVSAERNPVLTVDASSTPVSTAMVTAFIKNDDAKTLTLSYSTALKVSVDKADISDAAAADLDFSVSANNFLPADVTESIKATKVVQINFEGNGDLEGVDKVTVKYRVGAGLAGKTVTIYEYIDGKLVKIGTTKVGGSGLVNFKADHFGKFVLAVE